MSERLDSLVRIKSYMVPTVQFRNGKLPVISGTRISAHSAL